MIEFDVRIFFKWVGEKPPTSFGFVVSFVFIDFARILETHRTRPIMFFQSAGRP